MYSLWSLAGSKVHGWHGFTDEGQQMKANSTDLHPKTISDQQLLVRRRRFGIDKARDHVCQFPTVCILIRVRVRTSETILCRTEYVKWCVYFVIKT